jgi:3-hydroxymyristoyl/3-hydroxydecanoyl-(acyl carrier protein) dehydratase
MADELKPLPSLPHAAPFLMLDRMVEVSGDRGVFIKMVSAGDPVVGPDGTMPAVFVLEAMAQAGGAVLGASGGVARAAGPLAKVDGFRLHGPVRIGDELRIEARLMRYTRGVSIFEARATVEGELRAEARVSLAIPQMR